MQVVKYILAFGFLLGSVAFSQVPNDASGVPNASSAIIIGATPIVGGTNGQCIENNNGTAATAACSGGGGGSPGGSNGQIQYNNSGAFGGVTNATGALKYAGAGAFAQAACADLSNGVASCSTDTTNASNISSGTLGSAEGGAGTINGALKGNGAGVVSQAACADLSNAATTCSSAAWSNITGTPTTLSGYGITSPLPVAQGGTASGSASGTALDNITGFNTNGILVRTGAGTYTRTNPTGAVKDDGSGNLSQAACADLSNAGSFCSGTSAANLTGTLNSAQVPAFSGDCVVTSATVTIGCIDKPHPGYFTSRFYAPYGWSFLTGAGTQAANTIRCAYGPVIRKITISPISIDVTTLAANGNTSAALYEQNASGFGPGLLIANIASNISTAATGVVTVNLNRAVQIGPQGAAGDDNLWWCVNTDNSTAKLAAMTNNGAFFGPSWMGAGTAAFNFTNVGTNLTCAGASCNGGTSSWTGSGPTASWTWPSSLVGSTWTDNSGLSMPMIIMTLQSVP